MEWHIMNADGLMSMDSRLGSLVDNVYVVSDDCEEILQDLINQIHNEDADQRLVRRQFLLSGIVEKDLVPLIKHVCDDPSVFSACVRLLAQVTMPVECLLSDSPKDSTQLPWIPDIQRLLIVSKQLCVKYEFIDSFMTEIKTVIEDSGTYKLRDEDCDFINQGLILIRNLLHTNDNKDDSDTSTSHTEFLRTLFVCGLGDVIISLLSREQREYWSLTLIQLIPLLYSGQVVQLLRSPDLDDDASMCSDESEACGAECKLCASAGKFNFKVTSSDNIATLANEKAWKREANPNSDNLDTESEKIFKMFYDNCGMDTSDCGKSSSEMSSSNLARGQTTPSDENMSNDSNQSIDWVKQVENNRRSNCYIQEELRRLFFDFTCNFIKDGFTYYVVKDLKSILISTGDTLLDDSFLWSLSFFLKFARQHNLKFSYVRDIFDVDLFGFLTYEGIYNLEQTLTHKKKMKISANAYARRITLIISALKAVFKTLAYHKDDPNLEKEDQEHLEKLQEDLAKLTDLHQLFVLLIRHSKSDAAYLKDIIVTNHLFLVLLEDWREKGYCKTDYKLSDLIRNFATGKVMQKFSNVLSNFVENGHTVNNCIFTMMHHVAGDCGQPDVLLQGGLLKTFLEIWDKKFYVTQEINDLMEYVMQKFVSAAEGDPMSCAEQVFGETTSDSGESNISGEMDQECSGDLDKTKVAGESDKTDNSWVEQEEDILMMYFTELQDDPDVIEKIIEKFEEVGINKSESQIISQLCKLGWLENEENEYDVIEEQNTSREKEMNGINSQILDLKKHEIVPYCVQKLKDSGKSTNLEWLQDILCEVAYVKLDSGVLEKKHLEQAVPKYYSLKCKSVPLVLYSDQQEALLSDSYFVTLIQCLGFHTPEDVDMLFPRIPHFWSPDMLIEKAKQLGPLNSENLKFDISRVKSKCSEFPDITYKCDRLKNGKENGLGDNSAPGAMWIDAVQIYNHQKKRDVGKDDMYCEYSASRCKLYEDRLRVAWVKFNGVKQERDELIQANADKAPIYTTNHPNLMIYLDQDWYDLAVDSNSDQGSEATAIPSSTQSSLESDE